MAYDPNSHYIPPRRAYYEPPPPQQQYDYQTGYGVQEQQYDGGYYPAPPNGQNYQDQYGQWNGQQSARQHQVPQSPQYDQGYYGRQDQPKQRSPRQPNGYTPPPQQQPVRSERQHDPRYQQRSGRNAPAGYEQPRQDRGRQQNYSYQAPDKSREQGSDRRRPEVAPQQNHEPQFRQAQQPPPQQIPEPPVQDPRPNPRNARMYPGEAQSAPQYQSQPAQQYQPQSHPRYQPQTQTRPQLQDFSQRSADLVPPPRIQDPERPRTAPSPDSRQPSSSKMTMEEWKAKERAKMNAAMPETLAQDNAFPVFPTKRDRSKARSGTSSARASGELPRPPTSSSSRHERQSSKSRAYSDTLAEGHVTQQLARPPLNHQPRSYGSAIELPEATSPVSSRHAPLSKSGPSPVQRGQQSQWAAPEPEVSPQVSPAVPSEQWAHNDQRRGPSPLVVQQSRSSWADLPEVVDTAWQSAAPEVVPQPPTHAAVPAKVLSPRPYERAPPSFQTDTAMDTAGHPGLLPLQHGNLHIDQDDPISRQPEQRIPTYHDNQPLSPGPLQPRPSTAHGQRSTPPQTNGRAPPMLSQSEVSGYRSMDAAVDSPRSWTQPTHQADMKNASEQYGSVSYSQPKIVPAPARTREEEIEAEMPDFDSAAPGGMSLLHKRNQRQETLGSSPPSTAAVSTPAADYNSRGTPYQNQGGYGQQQNQMHPSATSQQWPEENDRRGNGDPIYGQPGQNSSRKIGASYGQSFQEAPQQYPPRAPYADERPRRSMDDARQMPYRQGTPGQARPLPNGQPPTKQMYPAQQPPGGSRNVSGLSVETSFSGFANQGSISSAPPTQQNFREFPAQPQAGAMTGRQRSDPNRPPPQPKPSSPDTLPHHPVPIRPGHMEHSAQPAKPPPVRNYDNNPPAPSHQRNASNPANKPARPVTASELQQLQAAVNANPNDSKRAFLLVKKLVEASTVLASDGGRADRQTQARNRERYIMDADKRLRRLASAGYPDAQFYLADCYGSGTLGLKNDPREAFKLYQAAAKAGHAQAAYRTAMCCELGPDDGGTTQDYGKAVQWYRRGAALGDADAMFKVGMILLKGLLGQPRSVGEAFNFLKRAVEQSGDGNPSALFQLAQLYESNQTNPEIRNTVVPDDRYALSLFERAAAVGHKGAQFRLGQAYEYGQFGTAIDNRASITWYTKAAAQGDHQAELALSGWYLTGAEGILQQSDTEAYLWARKAAASEPPLGKAMFAMGYFTETGIGCPKSFDEAKKWYSRAAAYKFPKAQERLEEIRRNGSRTSRPNGRLSRKDQKRDEENCVVM